MGSSFHTPIQPKEYLLNPDIHGLWPALLLPVSATFEAFFECHKESGCICAIYNTVVV